MNLAALEHDLRTYRPAGLTLPEAFVWPRYEGLSLGNLPATLAQCFGATLAAGTLPPLRADLLAGLTDGVERVVMVLLDGLGWELLQRLLAGDEGLIFHRLAERGRLLPITTTFISTTNSVLATLRSGFPPVQHGLLAYEMYLREFHTGVECISFRPTAAPGGVLLENWGLEPEKFLPVPSLSQQLAAQGIPSDQVIAAPLLNSALTQMFFRGVREMHGHVAASDFWYTLRAVLRQHQDERFLLGGYWSIVDTLEHRRGPQHSTVEGEVRSLSYFIAEHFLKGLTAAEREGTLLLFLADHGQMHTPIERAIALEDHPALRDALLLPTLGEPRVPFFYPRAGRVEWVREYLVEHFGDRFYCMTQAEVLASGLLGPGEPYAEVPHRLGDLVCIATDGTSLVRTREKLGKNQGLHGGLRSEEMLVPLLGVRLEEV